MPYEQEAELIEKIRRLEEENNAFRAWQGEITKVLQQMLSNFEKQNENIRKLQDNAFINRIRIESMPYEMRDEKYKSPVFIPKVLSESETRSIVADEKKSISRFGDGEFGIIAGIGRWNFQSASPKLAEKLEKVLNASDEGFLVCINRNLYGNLEHMDEADADGVRAYMRPEVRKQHAKMLDPEKTYGHALMNEVNSEESLRDLRKIWDQKECIFIEGQHTGMGVGNDLFDNCKSIERILCPSENAIDRYDDIMDAVLKQPKDKLILLALGPTATALSYDLFKEGYWSVDIGHIDLYYEKYIRNLSLLQDVSIPFKYSSWHEIGERRHIQDITDPLYQSQVIERIY